MGKGAEEVMNGMANWGHICAFFGQCVTKIVRQIEIRGVQQQERKQKVKLGIKRSSS